MAHTSKDAGEARQRPRPSAAAGQAPVGALTGRASIARPAGTAPVSAAGGAPAGAEVRHKGMISNPWVKHWAGAGPAPTTTRSAGATKQAKAADGSKAPRRKS
jgi:hypothetical protein